KKLFSAIESHRKPFKIVTFFYISLFSMVMVPFDFISFSMIIRYAALYLIVGLIMYGLYKNQPLNVLKIVSLLHVIGLAGRVVLEWTEWTPVKLFNVLIYAIAVPLYLYIIQLVLTLKRYASD
ncbi:MAG: hypothetical protein ABS873_07745, partial [Alkalibacterium sp.]